MPIHDWRKVDAVTFHAFHTAWITHLSETLNGGLLPSGYYAMPEPTSTVRGAPRSLAIRHESGHRVVALLEIVSPANKERIVHVEQLVDKAKSSLAHGIHLLLVDIFPPGPFDPSGIHGAIWDRFDDDPYQVPGDEPLTLASYVASPSPEAYIEHMRFGSPLADMPLFLNPDCYIGTPLEQTYLAAFRGMPAIWRDALE